MIKLNHLIKKKLRNEMYAGTTLNIKAGLQKVFS